MKRTYTIPEESLKPLRAKMARLEKKAQKYGVEFGIEVSEPHFETLKLKQAGFDGRTTVLVDAGEYSYKAVDVTLDDAKIIKKDGYEVVAAIDILREGNIVMPFGNDENPAWKTITCHCDHCNTNRDRKRMYIIRKDGKESQVGSACVKDYAGIDPSSIVASMQLSSLIKDCELSPTDEPKVGRYFPVVEALGLANRIYKKRGYTKADEPGSNKERLNGCLVEREELSPKEYEEAREMAGTIAAMDVSEATNLYLDSVQTLIKEGYIKMAYTGYIAYAPVAYAMYKEKLEKKRIQKELGAQSDWVGKIGDKVEFTVKEARCVSFWESSYGYYSTVTYIHLIYDEEGHIFKWKTTNAKPEPGARVKATVKGHEEYDGAKQTVITRAKW